ncbi:MAG: DUF3105 domain-containing protein [Solirubrobacteraceae bacterium]
MASRKEEKARLRAERIAREQEASRQAARKARVRKALIALAVLATGVVIAVIATTSGGAGSSPQTVASGNLPKLPPARTTDLGAAVKAAGCVTKDTTVGLEQQNRQHVAPGTTVNYATNPPSYGPHYSTPASDGDYAGRVTPPVGNLVHAMEHGRVEIQYRPGLSASEIPQLEALFNETGGSYGPGQYMLLFQNATSMPYAVAATAWDHVLACPTFNTNVFDALRAFRLAYTLKGPELINQPE